GGRIGQRTREHRERVRAGRAGLHLTRGTTRLGPDALARAVHARGRGAMVTARPSLLWRVDPGDLDVPAAHHGPLTAGEPFRRQDRKSTRLNSSHVSISYAVFCLKKKSKNVMT